MHNNLDCTTCGACCVTTSRDEHVVPIAPSELKRLPTKYRRRAEECDDSTWDGHYTLPLKRFGDRYACIALKGKLGKRVGCAVYAQRPDNCRTFEVGSSECLQARKEAGVD